MPKVLVAIVVAALISGAVYYFASSGSPTASSSAAAQKQATFNMQAKGPGAQGKAVEERKAIIMLRDKDGNET